MSSQLLTDEQKEELRSILETGDALQVQQLVRIGLPDIDAYEILRKRLEKRQDDPEIWEQVGYKEERRKQRWLHNFQRCSACGTLVLTSSHKPFICGHLYCPWKPLTKEDYSCCPICGPLFDPLWGFLVRGRPQFSKVEWPSMPDNLSDETELRIFSSTVVQAHRQALQKIPIEALVSFALNGAPTGITSFLESHNDLATVVEESKTDVAKMWAWDRASREDHRFELLKQALQIGLEGKPEQWGVSTPAENFLYTKTLSPIREIFKQYSSSEFLEYLPLLSRRLIRDGVLDTNFSIYDEITKFCSQRADEGVVKVWLR
ncbi:hypothetical protein B0J12DRAFT_731992 [Macrophomina phaseolina]|uniref:TniQ protein n=1 Tax=Macrophomina phaseolina TaxID=35725 RepID=A0ABQ8FXG3_9PEZI|nr:hypothetical protein B0J12DRAFT_731992 [Macrophomina phaseolina]